MDTLKTFNILTVSEERAAAIYARVKDSIEEFNKNELNRCGPYLAYPGRDADMDALGLNLAMSSWTGWFEENAALARSARENLAGLFVRLIYTESEEEGEVKEEDAGFFRGFNAHTEVIADFLANAVAATEAM